MPPIFRAKDSGTDGGRLTLDPMRFRVIDRPHILTRQDGSTVRLVSYAEFLGRISYVPLGGEYTRAAAGDRVWRVEPDGSRTLVAQR